VTDRIDDLVAKARGDIDGAAILGMVPGHAYRTITELATIAREAEAERDALLAEHEEEDTALAAYI
jgi:hypothetical protein